MLFSACLGVFAWMKPNRGDATGTRPLRESVASGCSPTPGLADGDWNLPGLSFGRLGQDQA